jgi:hypothetical protein
METLLSSLISSRINKLDALVPQLVRGTLVGRDRFPGPEWASLHSSGEPLLNRLRKVTR